MKSYVVIGLGRFGREIAAKLYACGDDVLVIDTDENTVDKFADKVTRAVAADARDIDVLKKLGVDTFDRAIVSIGEDLAASALVTMNLKSLNVPYIICKASDDTHRAILERLGANRVIIPEREMADKLALGLTSTGIMEYIELSDEYGIVEMEAPLAWHGKTIRELDLRSAYGINVLSVRQKEELQIPPNIDQPMDASMTLVILSSYDAIEKIKKL